jgi:hypothetical protein
MEILFIYILHNLKGSVALLTILFIICLILTKWSLVDFAELRDLHTSAQNAY